MFKRLVKKVLRKLRYCASVLAASPSSLCPTCGYISYSGKYCYKDGSKLFRLTRCTCGHPISKYAQFCQECGIEVKKEAK
jgi:hypothetical protein